MSKELDIILWNQYHQNIYLKWETVHWATESNLLITGTHTT